MIEPTHTSEDSMRIKSFVGLRDGKWAFGLLMWDNAECAGKPSEFIAPVDFDTKAEALEYAETEGRELIDHIIEAIKAELTPGGKLFRQDL